MHHELKAKGPEPLWMKNILQGDYSSSSLLVNLGKDLTQPQIWPAGAVNGCLEISANTHQTSCVCTYLKAAQTDREAFWTGTDPGCCLFCLKLKVEKKEKKKKGKAGRAQDEFPAHFESSRAFVCGARPKNPAGSADGVLCPFQWTGWLCHVLF